MSKPYVYKWILAAAAAFGIGVFGTASANAQQGIGERIGSKLDRGIERLSEEFSEGWESLKKSVDKMGVQGRVYSRLRWDKQLAEAAIEIDVEQVGMVTLKGHVPSLAAKQKALTLATDTVGVECVVDQLTVVSASVQSDL